MCSASVFRSIIANIKAKLEYMWCFERFATSYTILKNVITPMEECYF